MIMDKTLYVTYKVKPFNFDIKHVALSVCDNCFDIIHFKLSDTNSILCVKYDFVVRFQYVTFIPKLKTDNYCLIP